MQGVCSIGQKTEAEWAERAEAWRQFGATDLLVDTGVSAPARDESLNTPAAKMTAWRRIREVFGRSQDNLTVDGRGGAPMAVVRNLAPAACSVLFVSTGASGNSVAC
jgi:hypothetical protein